MTTSPFNSNPKLAAGIVLLFFVHVCVAVYAVGKLIDQSLVNFLIGLLCGCLVVWGSKNILRRHLIERNGNLDAWQKEWIMEMDAPDLLRHFRKAKLHHAA